jgi:diguanylate cyclase (GGDEF)-like protein/PAS domain S-box-containing protein
MAIKQIIIRNYRVVWFLLFSLLLMLFSNAINAKDKADESIKFFHFSTKQGLPQNTVFAINQDKEGFVWIGTQSGLMRFDGYRTHIYKHNPLEKNSISSNFISAITTDDNGRVWSAAFPPIINRLNNEDGSFSKVEIPSSTNSSSIKKILSFDNKMWLTSEKNFYYIDQNTLKITLFEVESKQDETAVTLLNQENSSLFLVKQSGIIKVNARLETTDEINFDLEAGEKISAAEIHASTLYIATNIGNTFEYDLNSNILKKLLNLNQSTAGNSNFNNISNSITQIKFHKNSLWLATNYRGLVEYSISSKQSKFYTHNSNKVDGISSNNLMTLMFDKSDLLWVGTSNSGFDRTTGKPSKFTHYWDRDADASQRINNDINSLIKTKDNQYWLTNDAGELKQLDIETNQFTSYVLPNAMSSTASSFPQAKLIEMQNGNILYGSRFGLWEFDRTNKAFTKLSTLDPNGIHPETILTMHRDEKQRLWLGSIGQGIGLLNETTKQVNWYPPIKDKKSEFSGLIINIENAPENRLWLGTSNGLFQFDIENLQYQKIDYIQKNDLLKNKFIRTLYKSTENKLWVGTFSGVLLLEPEDDKWKVSIPFKNIESVSNNIYSFIEEKQNIWISTNYGITRINLNNLNFKHFTSRDGLQGEEYNGNVALKEKYEIWFGGVNGLTKFNPSIILDNKYYPPVWITGYQIDDNFHIVHNPALFSILEIPAKSRLLRLEFSSLDYRNSSQNKYRIRNSDSSDDWLEMGNRNELLYSQLQGGTFNICIQGSNHDGVWNPSCRALTVIINSSFLLSNTAFLFYLLGIMLVIIWIFSYRKKRFLASQQLLNELKISQQKLNWSLQGSGDALWVWDIKSKIATRDGINRLLGYKPGEIFEPHTNLDSLIHPDDLAATKKAVYDHLETLSLEHFEIEYRMKAANGDWRWVLDRGQIVTFTEQGEPEKIAGTFRDITNRKKVHDEQKLSALIIRNMAEMVIVTDENLRIISANPSWCHKMGYQLHEVIGKDPAMLNSPNQEQEFYESVREHLFRFGNWQGEMLQTKKNSQDLLVYLELTIVKNSDQSIRNFVSVATDITEKKKAEDELRYLANYDMLTNLPNRTLFLDRLEHAILQAQRNQTSIALLFIDLDNFKNINDSLGHNYGDLLLKEAAQIISQCVRKDDTVSRLGGDEFTVILENITDSISVLQIAEKIIDAFKRTIQIAERLVTTTPSIGISLYPEDASNASSLVKFADTAMYFAKSQGKNNFQYYSESMNKNALRRLDLESHLRGALENDEFHLLYQPKVCANSGRITGMEALIRWNSPVVGNVTPDEFIPLAEDTGLIVAIGNWVLKEACQQAKKWLDKGFDQLEISVNLSFRQFKNLDLSEIVSRVLTKTDLPGKYLTLEITESLLMDNIAMATEQLEQLKQLGLKIAIDDFGTGYSSLNYLKQFPLDYLKIDRTFVKDILTNHNDASLTTAIIGLSHNLDLTVIAEGVEEMEQLKFLKQAGCEEIQGFLVSPPISHYEFSTLLEATTNKNVFDLLKDNS